MKVNYVLFDRDDFSAYALDVLEVLGSRIKICWL